TLIGEARMAAHLKTEPLVPGQADHIGDHSLALLQIDQQCWIGQARGINSSVRQDKLRGKALRLHDGDVLTDLEWSQHCSTTLLRLLTWAHAGPNRNGSPQLATGSIARVRPGPSVTL